VVNDFFLDHPGAGSVGGGVEGNSFMEISQKQSSSLVYMSRYLQHAGDSADSLHLWVQQENATGKRIKK
jgi:hypothetical protein